MNVYFTTSSEGVSKKRESCRRIISQIEKSGSKLSLNWIKIATDKKQTLKDRPPNPAKIFQENLGALTKSEVCIFETSVVSWGMAYQITYAITKEIPTLCLFDKKSEPSEVSNMLPGIKSKYLYIEKYEDGDLEDKVSLFLTKIEKTTLMKFNFIACREIKDYIDWAAKRHGVSQSEFLREAIKANIISKDKEYKKVIL